MGWSGGNLANNASQYGTINEYLADGLDGQFDFVLYYAVPLNVFADQSMGVGQADYWTQASGWEYVQGTAAQNEAAGAYLMSPYIGSQDTARFITIASYRGQTAELDPSIPYNQWTNIAGPPPDSDTYGRHRQALAWLLTIPGVPLVYYGDEYGQWGGVDPNNRMDWRGGGNGTLTTDETVTQSFTQKLGQARKNLTALRRGVYVPVSVTNPNILVFARQDSAGDVALVAISQLTTATQFQTALPLSLGLTNGTVLHDQMGGPDITVNDTLVTLQLPAQGVEILAP
jgi:glycosidase